VKKGTLISYLIIFMSVFLISCSSATEQNDQDEDVLITVSAAISLTDALEDIKQIYENENDVSISFNLAGSGTLAQQIQQGAPTDLFISANEEWMDTLSEEDLMVEDSYEILTKNKLVLITHQATDFSFDTFDTINSEEIEQIAVGNPETVPAGAYTKEALESMDLWDELSEKVVYAKDVRQVLTYIESQNADIGFVYESDAMSSDDIHIIDTAPSDSHEPIVYPMMIVKDSEHIEATEDFAQFLTSKEAQEIFENYGFSS